MIVRLLREPLLQFLIVGVLLFGAWKVVGPDTAANEKRSRIELTNDDVKQLVATWMLAGRPPPTPEQMQRLVDDKVREEVLYREALALGLDKDDTIVKRQLARKMEFLAEDVSKLEEPKPEELKAWYEKNAERFALPPRISFSHAYFSPDRRGARTRTDADSALARLAGKPMETPELASAGDPFMYQQYYGERPFDQIARQFGPKFAYALAKVTPGQWTGPIESGYGWHVVFAQSITPQRIPEYEEVETDVRTAWMEDHRDEVRTRMFTAMRERYEVVLPAPAGLDAKAAAGAAK